jgi:phosphate-selective porin OprO/OprP
MKSSFVLVFALSTPALAQPAQPTPVPAAADRPAEPPPEPPPASPETQPPAPPEPPPPPAAVRPAIDVVALQALVDERIAKQPKTAGYEPGQGFYLRSRDGDANLRLGGYTQFDGRYFYNETSAAQVDQFGFRSIRPELLGTVFDHYDFRLLPDFAGSKLVVQEAYVDVHYTDSIVVRFGKTKVPFGLERLQPEIATTFTERGLPTLLTPNRDAGVQAYGTVGHGLVSYQAAVVNGVADNASSDVDTSDHKELVGRIVASSNGLSIGAAGTTGIDHGTLTQTDLGSWVTQGQTTFFQYKTGTDLTSTAIANGRHWRAGGQASYYAGALGAQAEYVRSQQHVSLADAHGIVAAETWQVLAQYVLYGGTSTYKGVVPSSTYGAFDIAARFGEIRLTDELAFQKGFADPMKSARKAFSWGLGVDWLPNRSFRFVLDLERTTFRGGAPMGDRPDETSVVGRVQTVF